MRYLALILLYLAFSLSLESTLLGTVGTATSVIILAGASVVITGYRFGAFSPICMIYASSSLYMLSPAIGYLTVPENALVEPAVYFSVALPLSLAYSVFLLLAYDWFKQKNSNVAETRGALPTQSRMLQVAAAAIIGSGVYFASVVLDLGVMVGDISRGEQMIGISTTTQVIIYLAIAGPLYGLGLCVEASRRGTPYSRVTVMLFLLAAVIFAYPNLLILGDRRIFLSTIAALLSVMAIGRRKTVLILTLIIPLFFIFSLYSGFRGAPIDQWVDRYYAMDMWSLVDPSQGEFGGWGRIAQDVLTQPFSAVYRPTILEAPFSVTPKMLLPDRPIAPSLWYVQTFDPNTAARGGAWAFSIVVESYMNLWIFGPVLLGILFGKIIAKFEIGTFRRMIMVFTLAFIYRFDTVSMIQLCSLTVIFMYIFAVIGRSRVRAWG